MAVSNPRSLCSRGTRPQCFIAASPQERPPRFQDHRGFQMNVGTPGLPIINHFQRFSEVLCLVAVRVQNTAGQSMSGTCRVLYETAQASQAVVEDLLG